MTTVAPAAACGLSQATALWPNRSTASDGTIGDASHAARQSDHNPDSRGIVHAFDLTHDPAHGVDTRALADGIRLRAKAGQEPRCKYVISFSRIASPTGGWVWRLYDGDPHENHMHVSVNSGPIENDTSPWYGADQGDELTADQVREIKDYVDAKFAALNKRLDNFPLERNNERIKRTDENVQDIKAKVGA